MEAIIYVLACVGLLVCMVVLVEIGGTLVDAYKTLNRIKDNYTNIHYTKQLEDRIMKLERLKKRALHR